MFDAYEADARAVLMQEITDVLTPARFLQFALLLDETLDRAQGNRQVQNI